MRIVDIDCYREGWAIGYERIGTKERAAIWAPGQPRRWVTEGDYFVGKDHIWECIEGMWEHGKGRGMAS